MEITVSSEQARVPVKVFHIVGDIDTESYDELQDCARREIEGGARYIVLDLAQVPYVSSWGIRAISQVYTLLKQAAQAEGDPAGSQDGRDPSPQFSRLKLVNPNPHVYKVLTDTGLDLFLAIETDLHKAVTSF